MRSSIFSSSRDLPEGAVGKTWGVALGLVVVALAATEVLTPARGFQPSVKDGPELWSAVRARASSGGAPLVLVGSSRFMLGLDPETLATTVGRPTLQLAIDGSVPFPVLEDLSRDDAFHGIVLCELGAFIKIDSDEGRSSAAKPEAYLRYFHTRTETSDAEATARQWLQSRLVFLLPEVSPRQLVADLLSRTHARPNYARMVPGRARRADYTMVDVEAHRRHWLEDFRDLGPPLTDAEVLAFADELGAAAGRIRARGGDVVFFRMVSSAGVRALEEQHTPRAQWDLFAARVGATTFSYEDVPTLRTFVAADYSHLDQADVGAFSRALGAELGRRVASLRP